MSGVIHQSETSKDGSSPAIRKSKSLRKMFSKRLSLGNIKGSTTDRADRADAASDRGEQVATTTQGQRDPPAPLISSGRATTTVEEKEISSFNDRGNEFFSRGEYDAALRMYSEALKLLKNNNIVIEGDYLEDYMPQDMRKVRTARCLVNVGAVHIRREKYSDAISALGLSMRQSRLVDLSSVHYYRAMEVMADSLENVGLVLFKQKSYEQASTMYTDSIEARQKCLDLIEQSKKKGSKTKEEDANKHQDERNSCLLELSDTLFYMALLRERQGNIEDAVAVCEKAISLRREVMPNAKQDPNSPNLFSTIGRLYCHETIKRHQEALGYFHEVHRMKCEAVGRDHVDVVPSLNSIAFIYNQIGDHKKALVLSDRAIDMSSNGRALNKEACVAFANKGDAHRSSGEYEKAVLSYETALSTQLKCLGENDLLNAEVYEKLSETYIDSNDIYKGISALESSISVKRIALGPDNEELARSYSKLGEYYKRSGYHGHESGIRCHTRALRIFKHHDNKQMAAIEHNKIAGILKLSGEDNKALEHYMAALWHSREAKLPSTDPIVADTIKNVASFQAQKG